MELKSPKTKRKTVSRLITWSKMFRTPLLILLLLGYSSCDSENKLSTDLSNELSMSNVTFNFTHRHRHNHIQPEVKNVLSDIKLLRRHLNKEIVNFVMTDFLVDGEVENRIHYNGITAKETYVGIYGNGVRLRQLTDGRHLVQVIYAPNGDIQDCEYITSTKSTRNFLKTLRKELKTALDEEAYKITQSDSVFEDEKFTRHFHNVTFQILKDGAAIPPDISSWLDYNDLKEECLKSHKEMKFLMENKNRVAETSLARSRRSVREHFIVPGTKWCGAGQLAQEYNELGSDVHEDRCCRAHDSCKVNIGAFKRRFGYFNFRPFTVSHCRCDRRPKRDAMEILRVPGTKWCGKGFSATRYSQLGGYTRTDRCCRVHDLRCPFWIGAMENKYGLYNWRLNTLMHCRCDERLLDDEILSTRWLHSVGERLTMPFLDRSHGEQIRVVQLEIEPLMHCRCDERYSQISGYTKTDRCCRVHDLRCPFWIGPMENKYGLYNWRLNTLMHCRCDEKFRACLKLADTPVSNMVGKLFFNVVQSKCFVLKPMKVCVRRSWWGRCLKRGYTKQAFLRDNLPY